MIGVTALRRKLLLLGLLLPLTVSAGGDDSAATQTHQAAEPIKFCGPDLDAKKEDRLSEEDFTEAGAKEAMATLRTFIYGNQTHYDEEVWEHAIVRLNGWRLRKQILWEIDIKRTSGLPYLIHDFCEQVQESYIP